MKQRFSFFKVAIFVISCTSSTPKLFAQEVHTAVPYLSSVAVVNNVLAINNTNFDNNTPVAVEHFTVTRRVDGAAQLRWSSIAEYTNLSFFIEHSINGSDFVTVGEITALAIAQKGNSYDFLHKDACNGSNYYRIRMESASGNITYTEIQKIIVSNKKESLGIYPNPAIGSTFLSINAADNERVTVSLYDLSGNEISSQIVIVKKRKASLDVSNAGRGMYSVIVTKSNGEQLRGKLLVAF